MPQFLLPWRILVVKNMLDSGTYCLNLYQPQIVKDPKIGFQNTFLCIFKLHSYLFNMTLNKYNNLDTLLDPQIVILYR